MGVVLAPIFRDHDDIWWVSIIILVAVFAFIPFWVWFTNRQLAGLTSGVVEASSMPQPKASADTESMELTVTVKPEEVVPVPAAPAPAPAAAAAENAEAPAS